MKKYILFALVLMSLACKTLTTPIVYDKAEEKIIKEVELIRYLINNKNFEQAEKSIEENLSLYPDNLHLLHIKAWLFLAKGELDKSEELFNKVLSLKPKNPLALGGLARVYRIRGNSKKALELINNAISLQATHSILWFEKGLLDYEESDFKSAYVNFNKAYTLDNRNYDAYFFKYLSALKMGRNIDEIKNIWFEIEEKRMTKDWYYQYHVDALYAKGESDMALKIAQDGLKFYPNDIYLLNFASYLLYLKYLNTKEENFIKSAKEYILKCIDNSNEKLIPEIIDTYLSIIEVTENKNILKKEVEKYYLIFPDSEILIKWLKKIN